MRHYDREGFGFMANFCLVDYLATGYLQAEVQKTFFFLSSQYNCAIFSAAFKKF